MLNNDYSQILNMPLTHFTTFQLKEAIEEIIVEQQDNAMLGGLLVAEIKLALLQKYGIEVHSNRIHSSLFHMMGVKRKPFNYGGTFLYIYNITPSIRML